MSVIEAVWKPDLVEGATNGEIAPRVQGGESPTEGNGKQPKAGIAKE